MRLHSEASRNLPVAVEAAVAMIESSINDNDGDGGADNDGDCQLHGAVHRLIPSMVSAAKPLPNFDFMRHSPHIAAPLSAKPIYTHIRISEGDPVDAQFDEMTAICVTSHRESSSRSDR